MQSAMGIAGTATAYAWRIEPHWVEVVRRPLLIHDLPESWAGRTVVQLSDLHVGPYVDDEFLLNCFRRVKAWNPDLVVYTGDFVSCGWTLSKTRFEHIYRSAPQGGRGTLGVFGNHDYGRGWQEGGLAARFFGQLEDAGIQILRDRGVTLGQLRIVGVDDLWGTRFSAATIQEQLSEVRPHVVLCHNPDVVDLPIWGEYRGWILSGHTHGGQCRIPWLTSMVLPVKNTRYVAGEYQVGEDRRLYINRGLGHLARLRFAARPEITVFTLVAA